MAVYGFELNLIVNLKKTLAKTQFTTAVMFSGGFYGFAA